MTPILDATGAALTHGDMVTDALVPGAWLVSTLGEYNITVILSPYCRVLPRAYVRENLRSINKK